MTAVATPEQPRHTRIVATLGPATDPPEVLEAVLRAGVDVVRLNFSHGDPSAQVARGEAVRAMAAKIGHEVGILADLPGPKIRIETFADGKVQLRAGQRFDLIASLNPPPGDATQVGVSYLELPADVAPGDVLLLDDGLVQLQVQRVEGERIITTVLTDGVLSNRKGLNKLGGGLSLGALTERDRELIAIAAGMQVDFIAVSFCRDGEDMHEARRVARAHGSQAALVAKIERAEAIANLGEIIDASDVVMVARGDLGVEIGDAELPGLQKKIIREAVAREKVVITATQMLQSMVDNPIPTRAEVLDVANAVIDGTDAVMLSQETAAGAWPVKAVEAMARICRGAERQFAFDTDFEKARRGLERAGRRTAGLGHGHHVPVRTHRRACGGGHDRVRRYGALPVAVSLVGADLRHLPPCQCPPAYGPDARRVSDGLRQPRPDPARGRPRQYPQAGRSGALGAGRSGDLHQRRTHANPGRHQYPAAARGRA